MKSQLAQVNFPNFSTIQPDSMESTLKAMISENRTLVNQILAAHTYTFESLVLPLEALEDKLIKFWAPFSHLHAVNESEALRTAYNACLPLLTEYHVEMMQNESLFKAFQSIANAANFKQLSQAKRKLVENALRDFRLSGVHLNPEDKVKFGELQKKLSTLTTQFSENLLDATQAWTLHVMNTADVQGMPDSALLLAEKKATEKKLSGWVFTLDHPSYSAVMKYMPNREFRRLMYEAYNTRASDQGPCPHRFDNSDIMAEILQIRHALAQLLGFERFTQYSLVTKMAKSSERVLSFLNDLVARSKPTAEKEMGDLKAYAKAHGLDNLEAWDIAFYTEKLRESRYAVSQEELRDYFPTHKVLSGMFTVVNKLFGITITEIFGQDVWHPSVQLFELKDQDQKVRGYFYTDLYARPHKREGAWMDECQSRNVQPDGTLQIPIAFLTCNFSPAVPGRPASLTHEEVQTLFHEFGHCLHHMLTQVDYIALAGINGVPWDAVEFPSQFLEYWTWEMPVLTLITEHIHTKEPLPRVLYQKLIAAKNFQSGLHMLRQLEFALFDFKIHEEYEGNKTSFIQDVLNDVRDKVAVFKVPTFNRFQHSFSHIFAGGYAAGYYSYKWAEVLSSDAFSLFEEKGIFDKATGHAFLSSILEQGGVCDPMAAFIAFRGREPQIDPLLRLSGLT